MVTGRLRGAGIGRAPLFLATLATCALLIPAQAQQLVAPPPGHAASAPDAALKGDKTYTKFVIGLEREVAFQVTSLTSPNRVSIELPAVKLEMPAHPGDTPVGLVKSFRGGVASPGRTRIVIDVTGPVVVEKAAIEKVGKSARLVLDIVAAETAADAKAVQARRVAMQAGAAGLGAASVQQPPMPRPALSPQARAAGTYKPVIVIDPGHGGHDTGAQKFGTVEKEVVLSFALRLREKLQATGRYKVLMTRENDTFVELDERRAFAEHNGAALFIAVHADYARTQARGATIYSLRDSVATALQRSAKDQVADNVLSGKELAAVKKVEDDVGVVRTILSDLARREVEMTKERTSAFARSVIEYMRASTSLKDNPDRSAAFAVLKTAKVPSVLIELAYVSNEEDAQLLRSDDWRDKVSGSILTAVDNYFSHSLSRLPM